MSWTPRTTSGIMASPSTSKVAQKPTAVEYLKLINGPRVDVYVGKDKKHYILPKDLLCYHSTYFDRCFKGGFKEAKEGKLELLEDNVEDFEFLLEYILHGNLPVVALNGRIQRGGEKEVVSNCLELLEYYDKYNMQQVVSDYMFAPIRAELIFRIRGLPLRMSGSEVIKPEQIEQIFRVTEPGSRLRVLATQGALASQGVTGELYKKQELEIPAFAHEMLQQIRRSIGPYASSCRWTENLTDELMYA